MVRGQVAYVIDYPYLWFCLNMLWFAIVSVGLFKFMRYLAHKSEVRHTGSDMQPQSYRPYGRVDRPTSMPCPMAGSIDRTCCLTLNWGVWLDGRGP